MAAAIARLSTAATARPQPARNPSSPYQTPKPERRSWLTSRSVRSTLATPNAKLATANGPTVPSTMSPM